MTRAAWIRTALIVVLATFAIVFGVRLGWMYVLGQIAGESYAHPAPGVWRWQPWIHPPLYGEYMRLLEALSDRLWVGEELVAFWSGGVFAGVMALLGGLWARREMGPGWDVAAAVLLVFAASNLRPFENYPPARTLILAGAWALFVLHRRGGGGARWVGTLVLLWTAVELHLSSWFVLGPLWFFLALSDRGWSQRTARHTYGIGAWLLLFAASTYPGLFRVLGEGPGEGQLGDGVVRWSHVTLEWTDVWLFVPLVLWAVPAVRRGRERWAAASAAIVVYTGITWWLMAHNMAIGGPRRASHHYFELIDPLLALCALAALHGAWTVSVGSRKRAVEVATGLLLVVHVFWYLRAFHLLREMSHGWNR